MGGRLQKFLGSWGQVVSDRWVLETLEYGYALEFTGTPPSDMIIRPMLIPSDMGKRLALEGEISSLLQKRAIYGFHVHLLPGSQEGGGRVAPNPT